MPTHKRMIKDVTSKKVAPKDVAPKEPMSMTSDNVKTIESFKDLGFKGGAHIDNTFIVTLKDKNQAIHKTLSDRQIVGETSYYQISKILNFNNVPETISINYGKGDGSCQRWIPESDGFKTSDEYNVGTIEIKHDHYNDISKIVAQDMVTGSTDRHDGNIIIKNNNCYAIDNEDWGREDFSDMLSESLDFLCGDVDESGEGKLNAQYISVFKWVLQDLSTDDYKLFRKHLIKNIKTIIDNKDALIKYYDKYSNSKDINITRRLNNININMESLIAYYNKHESD